MTPQARKASSVASHDQEDNNGNPVQSQLDNQNGSQSETQPTRLQASGTRCGRGRPRGSRSSTSHGHIRDFHGLTANDRKARFEALENRLGPTPHTTIQLEDALAYTQYDVDLAEAAYKEWQARIRNVNEEGSVQHQATMKDVYGPTYIGGYTIDEQIAKLPSEQLQLSTTFHDGDFAYNGNLDLERREAVLMFADVINDKQGLVLSRGEAVMVLALSKWNLSRALDYYSDEESVTIIRAALSTFFDATRTDVNLLETEKEQVFERDFRVALFLTYTGFPSWYSTQQHLILHDYDLIKAMVGWVRNGIEPIYHKQDKPDTANRGIGMRRDFDYGFIPLPPKENCLFELQDDEDELWAPEPDVFMSEEQRAGIDLIALMKTSTGSWNFPSFGAPKKAAIDEDGNERDRQPGFVINYNVERPKVGAPDWTRFRFETMAKGKYFWKCWKPNKYLLAERGQNRLSSEGGTRDPQDNRKMFDWNNKECVADLRKWSVQATDRNTQRTLREGGQRLEVEELRYLFDLVQEGFLHHQNSKPTFSEQEQNKSFRISKSQREDWARRWNEAFAGKTLEGKYAPRRTRTGGNLWGLIKRWPKLCAEYDWKVDKQGNPTDADEENWPWEREGAEDQGGDDQGQGETAGPEAEESGDEDSDEDALEDDGEEDHNDEAEIEVDENDDDENKV